jgi:hypothetical protein
MNKKEYVLLEEVFQHHRATYGGRTDSIAIEILADLIRELEYQYPNFNKQMFIEGCTINEDDDLAGTLTNKFGL